MIFSIHYLVLPGALFPTSRHLFYFFRSLDGVHELAALVFDVLRICIGVGEVGLDPSDLLYRLQSRSVALHKFSLLLAGVGESETLQQSCRGRGRMRERLSECNIVKRVQLLVF